MHWGAIAGWKGEGASFHAPSSLGETGAVPRQFSERGQSHFPCGEIGTIPKLFFGRPYLSPSRA